MAKLKYYVHTDAAPSNIQHYTVYCILQTTLAINNLPSFLFLGGSMCNSMAQFIKARVCLRVHDVTYTQMLHTAAARTTIYTLFPANTS